MDSTKAGWIVIDREAGVLVHTYTFAPDATALTFVARMANGQLLVVSPSKGLTDEAAAELAEFGEVGAIVANNGFHHLGQAEWRARFPKARCFAPPESAARIKKKNKATLPFEPLSALAELSGTDVFVREVPNSKLGESWCWAKIDGGYAWYMSDVLANMPSLPAKFFPRLLFKLTKSGPGYKVFNLALKFMVKDKKATLRLLMEDLEAHPPKVVVPAHGDILSQPSLAADTRALLEAAVA